MGSAAAVVYFPGNVHTSITLHLNNNTNYAIREQTMILAIFLQLLSIFSRHFSNHSGKKTLQTQI